MVEVVVVEVVVVVHSSSSLLSWMSWMVVVVAVVAYCLTGSRSWCLLSYTLIVARIEAWGEEYDQPLASGYTHTAILGSTEGEPGRSRKVSKVKLKTQS